MLMNYKKFVYIFVSIIFIIIISYSYFVINHKNLYMSKEYPMWSNVKNIKDKDYNFIVIGDSRAKAGFKPNVFNFNSIRSVNLSLGGSTPIEGYFTLLNYLKNNEKPNFLLISYTPIHIIRQDAFWKRAVRFNFINYNTLKEVINNGKNIDNNKTLGNKEKLIEYYLKPAKYYKELKNGLFKSQWKDNKKTLTYLDKSKGHYIFGKKHFSNGLNKETEMNIFVQSELIDFYFKKLLTLANSKNIKLFYYTMPFNKSSYFSLEKEFKNSYDVYIKTLSEKYNFQVLNELYYLPNDNFGDSSHLYKGIDKVTIDIQKSFK